jgi:hypothetical protein
MKPRPPSGDTGKAPLIAAPALTPFASMAAVTGAEPKETA